MSKAFTKEDDAAVVDDELLPERPATPLPVTPTGLRALTDELRALVAAGAATSRRGRLLAGVLSTVVARAPTLQDGGAGFGCVVTYEDEDGGRRTWQVVGPDEADPGAGRISVSSPIARALLGRRAGDVVTLRRPGGDEDVVVVDVQLPG